jgi:hypothetical protein
MLGQIDAERREATPCSRSDSVNRRVGNPPDEIVVGAVMVLSRVIGCPRSACIRCYRPAGDTASGEKPRSALRLRMGSSV